MTGLTLALAVLAFPATSRADIATYDLQGFANVSVNLTNSTTAIVTFTATGTNLLIDSSIADVNVNGTYSVSGLSPSGLTDGGAQNSVDHQGTFNQTFNLQGGTGKGVTTVSFTLTATGTNSWATAASVLTSTGNGLGNVVAAHISDIGLGTTFFVGNFTGVPLPPAVLLFGTALAGLGILGRRRKKELAKELTVAWA
jgi:hypothetical protein